MFMNLITNSLKFRRDSVPLHIEIGVSDAVDAHASNHRAFFLSDNGMGMV